MKTLLAVGDKSDWDSYLKFYRQRRLLKRHNFLFKSVDYDSILKGKLPKIRTKKIIIFFFFPFDYWDLYIERKDDKSVYGNKSYYYKFRDFWRIIRKNVKNFYHNKEIYFVNDPKQLCIDRDKELTKKLLSKTGVFVPKSYSSRDYKKILRLVDKGKKLFIKVRFGSMGKGITYLEKGRWITNFRFRSKRIISKKSNYGWTFQDITGKTAFLKKLMKQDIIIEEAINPLLLKGRKFDLRLYVCFDKIIYIYPRSNECEQITTNISQGAKGEPQRFLKSIPNGVLSMVKKDAAKALKAMNLNFAGVDVMPNADAKKVSVIEVNTFPGFPKSKSYNLSKQIIGIIGKQKWI